ncbi:unnamed protein product [Bathycoccus prasinos]
MIHGVEEALTLLFAAFGTIKFQAGTWADESTTQAPNQVLYNSANGFVELGDMYAGDQDFGAFTSPFFSSASSTPIIPNKIDVSPVIHAGHDFYYLSGGSGVGSSYVEGDVLVYAYRAENEQAYYRTIQYQSGVWSDLNLTENPTDVATNNNSQNISITLGDTYSTGFVNPFYEAPTPPTVVSPLPVLSQYTQAFGMEYYQTVGTKYYYKSDSHSGTEIHGFGSQQNHNGTRYFSVSNPYYEAPAYRTGTAIDFTFSGGSYQSDGYTPIVDDIATSSGEVVGSTRHWKWDIRYQNSRYNTGSAHWLIFVPGTTTSNGVWTAVGGGANDVGTRNGTTITCGIFAIFDETNAFVDGLVPYGDIP